MLNKIVWDKIAPYRPKYHGHTVSLCSGAGDPQGQGSHITEFEFEVARACLWRLSVVWGRSCISFVVRHLLFLVDMAVVERYVLLLAERVPSLLALARTRTNGDFEITAACD